MHLCTHETMTLNIELKTLKLMKAIPFISAQNQFNNYNESFLMPTTNREDKIGSKKKFTQDKKPKNKNPFQRKTPLVSTAAIYIFSNIM